MREKVQRGSVSEAQWQAAQDMEEFGMNTLKELSVTASLRDIAKAIHLHKLTDGPVPPGLVKLGFAAEAAVKVYEAEKDYLKRRREGKVADADYATSYEAEVDEAIRLAEIFKRPLPLVEGQFGQKDKMLDRPMDCFTC